MHIYLFGLIITTVIQFIYGIIINIVYWKKEIPVCLEHQIRDIFENKCRMGENNPPQIMRIWDVPVQQEEILHQYKNTSIYINFSEYLIDKQLLCVNNQRRRPTRSSVFVHPKLPLFLGVYQFPEHINNFRHFIIETQTPHNVNYLENYMTFYSRHNYNHFTKLRGNITVLNILEDNIKNVYLVRFEYEYISERTKNVRENEYFKISLRILSQNISYPLKASWHKIYNETSEIDFSQYIFIVSIGLLLYFLSTKMNVLFYYDPISVYYKSERFNTNRKYFLLIGSSLLILEYPLFYICNLIPYAKHIISGVYGITIGIYEVINFTLETFFIHIFHVNKYWISFAFLILFFIALQIAQFFNITWVVFNIFATFPIICPLIHAFPISSFAQYIPCFIFAILSSLRVMYNIRNEDISINNEEINISSAILNNHWFAVLTMRSTPLNIWHQISLLQILFISIFLQYLRRIEGYLKCKLYFWSAFISCIISLPLHDYFLIPQFPRQFPYELRGIFMNVFMLLPAIILSLCRRESNIFYYGKPFLELANKSFEGRRVIAKIDYYCKGKSYKYRYNSPAYLMINPLNNSQLIYYNKLFSSVKMLKTNTDIHNFTQIRQLLFVITGTKLGIKVFDYIKGYITTIHLKLNNNEFIKEVVNIAQNAHILIYTTKKLMLYNIKNKTEILLKKCSNIKWVIFYPSDTIFFLQRSKVTRIIYSFHETNSTTNITKRAISIKSKYRINHIYSINKDKFVAYSRDAVQFGDFSLKYLVQCVNLRNVLYLQYYSGHIYVTYPHDTVLKVYSINEIEAGSISLVGEKGINSHYFTVMHKDLILCCKRRNWIKNNTVNRYYKLLRIFDIKNNKTYINLPNIISFDLINSGFRKL